MKKKQFHIGDSVKFLIITIPDNCKDKIGIITQWLGDTIYAVNCENKLYVMDSNDLEFIQHEWDEEDDEDDNN